MLPQITFWGFTISLYGAWILAGFIVGIIVAIILGKKIFLLAEDVLFASLFGIIGLVVGGKLLYLLINARLLWEKRDYILGSKEALFEWIGGGFIFFGGLLGAVIMMEIYCRKYKIPFEQMMTAICPAIPLIHAFGRIGCFFAGCCYGISYSGMGHIVFTRAVAGPNQIALFPVQLVEAAVNLFLAFFLLIQFHRKKKANILVPAYCIGYGISRFLLEYLRGDSARGFWLCFSVSQWISICVILLGAVILYRERWKRKRIIG